EVTLGRSSNVTATTRSTDLSIVSVHPPARPTRPISAMANTILFIKSLKVTQPPPPTAAWQLFAAAYSTCPRRSAQSLNRGRTSRLGSLLCSRSRRKVRAHERRCVPLQAKHRASPSPPP